MQYSRIVIIFIFVFVTALTTPFHSCYAHIVNSKKVQVWKNADDNLNIEFGYKPEKPIIDTFTNLQFSITDLRTGEHIKDSIAHVTITNG